MMNIEYKIKIGLIIIMQFIMSFAFSQGSKKTDLGELIAHRYVYDFFKNSDVIYIRMNDDVCSEFNCEGELTLFRKPIKMMKAEEQFMYNPDKYISFEASKTASGYNSYDVRLNHRISTKKNQEN